MKDSPTSCCRILISHRFIRNASPLECGDLCRFGPRRLDAAIFSQLRKQRRDRSRRKTALKGQRTPKNSEAATLTRGGFR
jgi:hypothetical protein